MSHELFSRRHNLRGTSEELIHDYMPADARTGVFYIFSDFVQYINDINLIKEYCETMRKPLEIYQTVVMQDRAMRVSFIEKCLGTPNLWELLDLLELISLSFYDKYSTKRGEFSKKLNSIFREENVGYEMQEGKIERTGNEYTDEQIKNARRLLKEQEFKSADELFQKAIKAFNERPNPDKENCIKDAVAAIESIGKILSNNEKAKLDDYINNAVRNGIIPQPLDQIITKLHSYRGNEPAVAHGGIKPSKVTVDEAEFVLAVSAAAIIYLVKKNKNAS